MEGLCKPKIKICGLRTPEDARLVNAVGADYAGFVFHAKSRRNLSIGEAREIMHVLDPQISRVAVCVSPSPERVRELQMLPFDIIQIHGTLSPQALDEVRIGLWRAINLHDARELVLPSAEEMQRISGILIDAKEYGSGRTFDWNAAEQIRTAARSLCDAIDVKRTAGADRTMFILAGGLQADNAAEGIRLFAPDAVDVSSGVEYDPSCVRIGKDPAKLRRFVDAVHG